MDEATIMDCLMHYVAVGWKVIAALIPPAHYAGGLPCFVVALGFIGICSTLISDLASIFGCLVGLTDTVTSISLVAMGTSLPDTFASMLSIQVLSSHATLVPLQARTNRHTPAKPCLQRMPMPSTLMLQKRQQCSDHPEAVKNIETNKD